MELDDLQSLGTQSIAEILATRLSLSATQLQTTPAQKPLILYLAQAHRKASDELKTLASTATAAASAASNPKKQAENDQLKALLEEIQTQVVSYAASSLMEPDLFEQAKDGIGQLTKALLNPTGDLSQSLTFGVHGPNSSFYYLLCEELISQDEASFQSIIVSVVQNLMKSLKTCESLDSGVGDTSALGLVAALTSVCSHKKAALAVAQSDLFLIPAEGTSQAAELIRPPVPPGADLLRMLGGGDYRPYQRRSGPGLEKETLLGTVLRISTPKSNPAFSPSTVLRQSLDSAERATNQQRSQLKIYQDASHQLIMSLIKGGPAVRAKVLQWFQDCQRVNPGATAMRPDTTKVSSSALLLNVSVALLKLCQPFVTDTKKHHLIDPSFVWASEVGRKLFPTTGDDAIPRLGDSEEINDPNNTSTASYAPKNAFIPEVFFLAARSLALGIVPLLSSHENLLRHISHQHWELSNSNNGRDIYSDPHFCMMVSRQRSQEVALFQEEMVTDTLLMSDLIAKVLVSQVDDAQLAKLPEHLVQNMCEILMSLAKLKAKLLKGISLKHVFQLVVKLLSPSYTKMVRNYNLRAQLGDVLYEIFLPSTGAKDKRDVPASVACDPSAFGQTFLLSDPTAQKTLAPSLLLLYGEVEHTGYYDKMSHRAKISSLLKYLWESSEHRPAFREITQNKESFIKFANGIINETNTLIATVMQKLPEIRAAQEQMASPEWGRLSEEEQGIVTSRLDDNEREVKHALPLCNKTLQMFGYLNTDADIRSLFLLGELCPRLVNMLLHVLGKLVGSKGLDLKVKNPEQYEFRPKEMLRDLCAIFGLFAFSSDFATECAKSGCDPNLLRSAVKTCQRYTLLTGDSMTAFASLPDLVQQASASVAADEELLKDAPDDFLDEIMSTFMTDPVVLPSGHYVDRSTITQHLLNDPIDPFNREEMTIDDVRPATELKARIDAWLAQKRQERG